MRDLEMTPGPEPVPDPILLVRINESYWLLQGEAHLNALLAKSAPYPTPVRCLSFDSVIELRMALIRLAEAAGETIEPPALADLWGIHPAIVERLKRDQEFQLVAPEELG